MYFCYRNKPLCLWRKANQIWADWRHFMRGINELQASLKDDTTTINVTTKPSTFDILTILHRESKHGRQFRFILDTYQQTNLATHNPIQEKIKHPTAQKELKCGAFTNTIEKECYVSNFCHRTSGTFGFAQPTSRPFCKAQRATFYLHMRDSRYKYWHICRTPT